MKKLLIWLILFFTTAANGGAIKDGLECNERNEGKTFVFTHGANGDTAVATWVCRNGAWGLDADTEGIRPCFNDKNQVKSPETVPGNNYTKIFDNYYEAFFFSSSAKIVPGTSDVYEYVVNADVMCRWCSIKYSDGYKYNDGHFSDMQIPSCYLGLDEAWCNFAKYHDNQNTEWKSDTCTCLTKGETWDNNKHACIITEKSIQENKKLEQQQTEKSIQENKKLEQQQKEFCGELSDCARAFDIMLNKYEYDWDFFQKKFKDKKISYTDYLRLELMFQETGDKLNLIHSATKGFCAEVRPLSEVQNVIKENKKKVKELEIDLQKLQQKITELFREEVAFLTKPSTKEEKIDGKNDKKEIVSAEQKESDVEQEKIKNAQIKLQNFFDSVSSGKKDVWKDKDGNFNTKRLASDLTAGVVLGTVGGVVSGVVIKKKQIEKGFEALHCTVGGQTVADWGDTFTVGLGK